MLNQTADADWNERLKDIFESESFANLSRFLETEIQQRNLILPPRHQIFEAFNQTPFSLVKVVIIGQDPYHGLNQAHGLSFSVNEGIAIPPSLKNIFKAIQHDYPSYKTPVSGNLSSWARQGVLLLNSVLTVREKEAGSHQKKGWENFTDEAIRVLDKEKENLVFMLWGNYAKQKANLINANKHLILTAPHPSPLSAHHGFISCKHFVKTNDYLLAQNIQPIVW